MSITDELRNWMENAFTYKTVDGDMFHKVNTPWFGWKRDIEEMLDRIDAEHESKVSYWQGASYRDGYDEGFASADDYFIDKRETLKEHGWVKLPVDADGVPIHVGDVMCNTHKDGFMAKRVTGLCLHSGGRWTAQVDEVRLRWHDADKLRHYTPPTVEDVLTEFADEVRRCCDTADTIAEYAKRLRLAGEDE